MFASLSLAACHRSSVVEQVTHHLDDDSSVLDVPGFGRKAYVENDTGRRLSKLIEVSGIKPFINGGKFTINNLSQNGLSILVLSPKSTDYLDLGAMNGAYDRTGDIVLIGKDVIPSSQTLARLTNGETLTPRENAEVRFCQFMLLHELGHREKGSKHLTRFYFDGSWLSASQSEELTADRWAMESLFGAVRPSDAAEEAKLVRDIAQSALRAHFGKRHALSDVPRGHPSMFYRIANLYKASSELIKHGRFQDVLPEADSVWNVAQEIENTLVSIVSMPDGKRIEDIASTLGKVFIVSTDGVLYRCEAQRISYGDALVEQNSSTVRRYWHVTISKEDEIAHFLRHDGINRIAIVADSPYLVNISPSATIVYDSRGMEIASILNPVSVQSPNNSPVIAGDANSVEIVFRESARIHLVSINVSSCKVNYAEMDLRDVAAHELVDVIGVRGDKVLVH